MQEIKITRAQTLKEKPESSTLVFGKSMTDHMFIVDYDAGQGWHDPRIVPYAPLQIDPAAKVLHYAQEIFEGLKAYRTDDGSIQLFRPMDNIRRMNDSAERISLPQIPEELALAGITELVKLERDWVPHEKDAPLYIRPFMIGLDAALGYARQSGIPYGMGFIKNKYIGRTFISPTQAMRENEVNIKLNPIRSVVEGKRVVLIDDSIVRGTTCRRTIDLLRKAGAKEIHMRVSAPPFVAACYYGTDIDDPSKLIANNHSVEEIAKIIGVDSLGYLSLQDVVKLADNTQCGFCTACFGGGYPTAVPQDGGKDRFECKISERERT